MIAKFFFRFDWPLFIVSMLLSFTGIMMVYSTSFGSGGESALWVRQIIALVVGLLGLFFFSRLDYRFFARAANTLYFLAFFLLLLVLFFGQEIRGSVRWFDLGFFNFQPAEFSKLALIAILANFFHVKSPLLKKFPYVLWSGVFVAATSGLLIWQPDLGSAIIHVLIWVGMLLLSPAPRRFLFYVFLIFLILAVIAWAFLLLDYQKDRIRSFANPTADPTGRGYNVIQSIVAVGSGGVLGSGLARGLQSQLKFLPERQTDFIFASTVEELGFVGGSLVLLLFLFFLVRTIRIMRDTREPFGFYLAAGIFFLVLSQLLINVGMNLGLLPVTGVTLPFLSYGGSSLMITCWLVGILLSVAKRSHGGRFAF